MRAGLQNTALLLASERSTASPHWVVDIFHLHTNLICASWDSIRPSVNVVLQRVPYSVCRVCLYLYIFTATVSLFRPILWYYVRFSKSISQNTPWLPPTVNTSSIV